MRFWTWLLARLLAVAVILGLALWYRMPDSGQREFRRSIEALKKVNSFHYQMVADVAAQYTEQEGDLGCSGDVFREATHVVTHGREKDFSFDTGVIRTGGQQYHLENGLWTRGQEDGRSVQRMCQDLVAGENPSILPSFDQMTEHGIIEKRGKKTVNGGLCREWRVTVRSRPGPMLSHSPDDYEHRILCIGVDDHLPREMASSTSSAHWTYAFNVPVNIDIPSPLAPERPQYVYQPPPPPPGLSLSNDKDDSH
jgi:hypothetical protein